MNLSQHWEDNDWLFTRFGCERLQVRPDSYRDCFPDKKSKKLEDEKNPTVYRIKFDFMEESDIVENDTLTNIHFTIGSNIARILDKKLKNK